jgi:HEAT repeat protein
MAEHGIRTIWANEFDLSVIHSRRRDVELTGKIPQGLDEIENDPGPADVLDSDQQVEFVDELRPGNRLHLLLGQLSATLDEDAYLLIVRQAVACADSLILGQELAPLFPLVELLTDHVNDPGRGERLRESARFGLEQLVMNDVFLRFLLDHIDQAAGLSHVAGLALLRAGGPVAVNLTVEKMGSTDNLTLRKTLSTLLVGMGESAVPAILGMMGDTRWYIIRNLSAILGGIGACEAIPELQKCLQHSDIRVSKEAIRSLAKIGGRDAEKAIIEVLRGNDPSLFPQVIASLGGMKSRKALVDLMHIVCSADMFLNYLPLKINALAAIAMIGDRQVVPIMVDMLSKGHIVVPGRWKQFHIAIAGCLARLGDARALPILKKKASGPGELGRACAEAAESITREDKQHGVA